MNDLFYRAGNSLVSSDMIITCFFEEANPRIEIYQPGLPSITIQKKDHPEEYKQYIALHQSTSLLIHQIHQRKNS